MNNKHKKTLQAIFTKPTLATIRWRDIESLMIHIGCTVKQGNGSRVRFEHNDVDATFHEPHPYPETAKSTVDSVRRFLMEIGVKNDT